MSTVNSCNGRCKDGYIFTRSIVVNGKRRYPKNGRCFRIPCPNCNGGK